MAAGFDSLPWLAIGRHLSQNAPLTQPFNLHKANAVPVAASFKKPVPERPRRLAVKPSSALALRVQASSFLYRRSKHASQTHRFLIRRAEAADQDRSWVHEFPVDQLRVFAGTYAHDQRAGLLAVDTPLTSSMTLPRAAVALSSAATVRSIGDLS